MEFQLHISDWELTVPFRITGSEWVNTRSLVVQLVDDGHVGRGEAQGVYYMGESAESILQQAQAIGTDIRRGATLDDLQHLPATWRSTKCH